MDLSVGNLVKLVTEVGPIGLVIFFWWYDNRRIWIVFEQHKKDIEITRTQLADRTTVILEQYRGDMLEQREMYRANASLCREYSNLASDLRNIVSLNIQAMTRVDDAVRQNQYCPMVRVDRVKKMTVVEKENG
jgi:hypothetical protein